MTNLDPDSFEAKSKFIRLRFSPISKCFLGLNSNFGLFVASTFIAPEKKIKSSRVSLSFISNRPGLLKEPLVLAVFSKKGIMKWLIYTLKILMTLMK